jgi:hypothetical protein
MKSALFRILSIVGIVLISISAPLNTTEAQCPMCKISAESNLKSGGSAGRGLNTGIIYMLATPYLLVGVIGYIWWRNRKKVAEDAQ